MPRVALISLVAFLAGCARETPTPISATEETVLADTIRQVVRDYVAVWSQISCDNQGAVLRFFDYSGPGFIDGHETEVMQFAGDSLPRLIKAGACADSEVATLDSLLVRVLTRDVVTASWTYRATYTPRSGAPTRSVRGAVLQVFRRGSSGWQFPVAMSTHVPVTQP